MLLTDKKLQALKKLSPIQRLLGDKMFTDGDGLHLKILKSGGMSWRWKTVTPKNDTVSYGTYPKVSLAEAREKHRQTQADARKGIHHNEAKRAAKLARRFASDNSFEIVAREWFETKKGEWAKSYGDKILARFINDVFPVIGKTAINSLQPPAVLVALRSIEARGALETAHRALENIGQVFRYAVVTGRIQSDPSRDLKGALKKPTVRHMPAITDPRELGALLRAIDGYAGTYVVRAALQLAPMLLLRPGELRFARWEEFALDDALWSIPPGRMKRTLDGKKHGDPHLVFLPRQAVSILRELHQLTGPTGLVFRGERDHERAMSENTINAALRRMGYNTTSEMTGHGFRATARTILDEVLGWKKDVIEAQLAHSVSDSLGRAYNRTEFKDQRRKMLQAWADYLNGLQGGDNVVAVDFSRAA
jgi:integrase